MRGILYSGGLVALFAAAVFGQTASPSGAVSPQRAFLNQNCAGCHNDKLKSGGITMTKLDVAHPDQTAELAEKVIRMLQAGMMPPAGMPRPNAAAQKTFVTTLQAGIDQVAFAHPNPGRTALHRLNRTEYANRSAICWRSMWTYRRCCLQTT